jgi:hypothetical protein
VFVHATGRDYINDFGVTTPKALARSFTDFASRRPALLFHIDRFPQIDGTIRRSLNNRNFTEKALVSKKYALTMLTTKPEVYGAFALTYLISGWYNLDAQYKHCPTLQVAELKASEDREAGMLMASTSPLARRAISPESLRRRVAAEIKQIRTDLFGEDKLWKNYRDQFKVLLDQAFQEGLFLDRQEFASFYKDLELQSEPELDGTGNVSLQVMDRGQKRHLGITREKFLNSDSDPTLAYKIMLSKVNYVLSAPGRNRLTMPEFQNEWALLHEVAAKRQSAGNLPTNARRACFQQEQEIVTGKKRAQKFLVAITH